MNVHKNARTTPHLRAFFVEQVLTGGRSPQALAAACGVSPSTVYKWLARHRNEGPQGLQQRSSRPHAVRSPTSEDTKMQVEALRRTRQSFRQIAAATGLSPATVARICKARGLSRLTSLDPKPPIIRYEKAAPGEMIHIDIKKLVNIDGPGHRVHGDRKQGKGKGVQCVHMAVDDHSRLAYSEIFPDETRASCLRFLFNALRFYRRHGIRVERVMTDNGPAFKSHRYAKALRLLKIKHKRTKPYTPKTNGKVERFVQTSLREWAYARSYAHSGERQKALPAFLDHYNHHRPHMGIHSKPPISRIPVNNLLRNDI